MGHSNMSLLTSASYATSNLEPYVDASEAARFLKIHPKTLMRLARARAVPAYSFNDGARRHWRFLKSELDIWMRSRLNSSHIQCDPCPDT
jgi:excisionase family DNA binding protein